MVTTQGHSLIISQGGDRSQFRAKPGIQVRRQRFPIQGRNRLKCIQNSTSVATIRRTSKFGFTQGIQHAQTRRIVNAATRCGIQTLQSSQEITGNLDYLVRALYLYLIVAASSLIE